MAQRYRDHVPGSHQYNPFELFRCCQRRTAPDYQRLLKTAVQAYNVDPTAAIAT